MLINQYTQEAACAISNANRFGVPQVARQIASGEKKVRKIHTDNLDSFSVRPRVFQDELP